MCEPDPVFTRARSSSYSSTCHRRRRLWRQLFRPRQPRRTERGSVRRSHRCSWISFPDIFGTPGRGRRGCVNLIRRSHELDLHLLHRHATEEEGFGGGCSVRVDPTTTGANGWWGRHRRKNEHRRGRSRCYQVQGQGCADLGVRTCTAPVSGGAGSTASWYSQRHTFVGPRSSWWISGCSRPSCMPMCWHERDTVAWTGYCSF